MKHADILNRDMLLAVRGMHVLAGAAATVLVLMFAAEGLHGMPLTWLLAMWLIELAQEACARWRLGAGVPERGRMRLYAALNLLACIAWGATPLLLGAKGFWQELTLGLYLYGVTLVPAVLQSAAPRMYTLSAVLCMGPFAVTRFVIRDHTYADQLLAVMLLAATAYGVHLSFSARRRALRALHNDEERERAQFALATQTHRLQETQARLSALRRRDPLTGVATLEAFCERLAAHLGNDGDMHVAALDVIDFRAVNHAFGWDAGNYALSTIAARMADAVGDATAVTRIAGAEFALLVGGAEAGARLTALLQALREPVAWSGGDIRLQFRAGLARAPRDGHTAAALVEASLLAMRDHRRDDARSYNAFSPRRVHALRSASSLRWELAHALDRNEFELYFQPKVELAGGGFGGVEALIRWHHPQRGLLGPDQFIGIAEDSGLIVAMGQWALCRAARTVGELDLPPGGHVAVNISLREFASGRLVEHVEDVLAGTGIDPALLQVELTESVVMGDPLPVCRQLERLRRLGLSVALDDFGSGYSSLRYLRELPIDCLKLDRSFIQGLPGDPRQEAIVAAVLRMARELDIAVVSEGVERRGQRDWLVRHGCRYGQGYLFARPMPAATLHAWLAGMRAPA